MKERWARFVIQSLERAFDILELLDRAGRDAGIGVQEISSCATQK